MTQKHRAHTDPLPPFDAATRAWVLALWPAARALAARRCQRNFYRLMRGEGGFYDADDFWQDLFIEFWALLQQPALAHCTWEDAALPAAWDRALYGAGIRILRRSPQRLWRRWSQRLEWPVEPLRLDQGLDEREETPEAALPTALLVGEDAAQTEAALARVAALEARLAALRPAQRQVLYMTMVQGQSAQAVGAQLGLTRVAVSQRVRAARRRARRETHG